MKFLFCAVALFLAGLGSGRAQVTAAAPVPEPVRVAQGLLQGAFENGLTVYRGIPFAAPPVGDLRWRAPQPAATWDGVRAAVKFAPEAVQGSRTGPNMS